MKPFDLDTYKADPSREIVTRDGHKARIICTDKRGGNPIIALVFIDGNEIPSAYTELGHFVHGEAKPQDLFFASVKHQGWINIYKYKDTGDFFSGRDIYPTEEDALCPEYIQNAIWVATIQIKWEE